MGDRHDYVALEWVKGEIGETLKQARQALEAFVENPQDPTGEHLTLGELQRSARNVLRQLLSSGKVEAYVPTEPEWREPVVH